jgi:Protein of unknown function (DUF1236)
MKQTTMTLAAALLLSGIAAASAAGMSPSSSHSTMGRAASDTLRLTSIERETAWNDLRKEAATQNEPRSLNVTVGTAVPTTLKIEPVPRKVAEAIPALRPYDFAMVRGKLAIVNPADKKIVEVITG